MNEGTAFGAWLRQHRKEVGVTQDELADQIGCSLETLQKMESGKRRPSRQIALLLAEYLKVPSDERQAFVVFARTGRQLSGTANPTAPWRNALLRQTNLPVPLTPLIGREKEEEAALNLLLSSRARLLTLVGPPGIGKTRLGLQVAANLVDQFEDGVYFLELATIVDPEMVLPAIARALGLQDSGERPVDGLLLDYLRQRRILLVLDNFEQILDASTALVRVLEACPWVKVLVTSREALHVRGERRFLVPPLAMPDLGHLPPIVELARYPSVELFVERAGAVVADFSLSNANATDVAAVCVGLEGLPLAIELAASRSNLLSPADMRVALTSRLKLLRTETRDLPTRQRTLRGAIEWSYNLLASEEQRLFRKLGVFVGGFTPDAVDAVCRSAAGESGDPMAATLEALESLVDKSLLRSEGSKRPEAITDGLRSRGTQTRFGMLETIREFVREKVLESELPVEVQDVGRKHALHFMTLAEEAAPQLRGPSQQEWLGILEDEHSNLLAALNWAWAMSKVDSRISDGPRNVGAAEIGLRIAVGLWLFWYVRGYFGEGREHLEEALARSASLEPSLESPWSKTAEELQAVRARAHDAAATMCSQLGDFAAATRLWEESLLIRRKINDKNGIANTLNNMGMTAQDQGDYAAARAYHQESLALWREVGNKQGIALALTNLGRALFMQGEYEVAGALHEESLAVGEEVGDKRGTALCLTNLGLVLYAQEKYDQARTLFDKALTIQRELGNRWGVATLLTESGNVSCMLNDYTSARELHEQSLSIWREMGYTMGIAHTLNNLALLAFAQGEYESARALFQESLALQRGLSDKVLIASNLAGLGGAAAIMQAEYEKTLRGAKLLGASDALKDKLGVVWMPGERIVFERGVAAAQAYLSKGDFERAWAEGKQTTLEEALSYALQEEDAPQ